MKLGLISKKLLVISFASTASTALALVDAEVFYGQQTADVTYFKDTAKQTKKITATAPGASLRYKPLPIIPLSFGLTVSQATINYNEIAKSMANDALEGPLFSGFSSTASGTSKTLFYGPEVKLWVPTPFISPFVKAAYLWGNETLDVDFDLRAPANSSTSDRFQLNSTNTYRHTATSISVGIDYSPVKLTHIFAEYVMHTGKRKNVGASGAAVLTSGEQTTETPITYDAVPESDKKYIDANASGFRLGVSLGI